MDLCRSSRNIQVAFEPQQAGSPLPPTGNHSAARKNIMLWRSLFQQLLTQQVREKMREAVTDAIRNPGGIAGDADEPAAPPPPADVAFVFALGIELGGLEDLLSGVLTTKLRGCTLRHGGYKGRSIVIAEAGVGRLAAARATQTLIAGHKPSWVISAGFAGGLDPRLKRGNILLVDSLADIEGHRLSIDIKPSPEWLANSRGLHVGRLLTVDKLVRRPEEKRALGQAHDALAVDMESWAVGEVCRQDKVRFMAVRIISDTVDDELPADVERLMLQKNRASRLGAAAGAIWRRPSSIKDMYRLKEEALVATDKLAKFLTQIICQLVPVAPPPVKELQQEKSA
jgi:adenosylhomocysteine nucleosidase